MGKRPRPRNGAKRIAILGWYGSDNAGDEAVLQSVVESLRRHGYTDLLALSTNPGMTQARHNLRSVSRSPFSRATLRAVFTADALVLGGGGLIQDSSSVYNLPLYAFYVALARLRGLTVIGWGLGAGPLYTRLGQRLARFICNGSAHFSVRDPQAKRTLVRAGAQAERVVVSADPAFLVRPGVATPQMLPDGKPTAVFCIRHRLYDRPGLNPRYLLPVSVRHRLGLETRHDTGDTGEDERFVASVAHGVRFCTQELCMRVVLLPFWAERDDQVLREIEARAIALGATQQAISWAEVEHTPSSLAASIAQADLLVSMRLHALIFGAAAGVPSLALSYVPKVRSLMRLLGAERWVVEVQTRLPLHEEIEMKLGQLWALRQVESQKLGISAAGLRDLAEEDAACIAGVLGA